MHSDKKDRLRGGTLKRSGLGLRPQNDSGMIIPQFRGVRKPNFPGGGGVLSMTWELALMTIGTGWLIRQLFRLIDKIEG